MEATIDDRARPHPLAPGLDPVVARRQGAELPGPGTVPIELVALQMRSREPIEMRTIWGRRDLWDVHVTHSRTRPSEGAMTIRANGAGGDDFSSELNVHPRFTFVRKRDGKVRTLDGRVSLTFKTDAAPWSADVSATTPPIPQPGLSPGFAAGVGPAGRIPVDHLPEGFPGSGHSVVAAAL